MVFVPLSSLEMYVFFTTKMGASLGMQGEEGTADEGSLGSTLRSLPLKYEVKVSRLLFRFFGLGNSASLPFFGLEWLLLASSCATRTVLV